LWCGILISTQPFFIAGVEEPIKARTSAFGAMGMFIACFVMSMAGIWYDGKRQSGSHDKDDGDYVLAENNNNNLMHTYGTST
jgi:hypothetical protein